MEPGFAKTVERYNPNQNTWGADFGKLAPEVTSIEGAAICHFDEDVFIIGGWKNSDDVDKQYRKEAYRYCAERKRWMLLPPMPQPRCRATACHVRIPYRFLSRVPALPHAPKTWHDSETECNKCGSFKHALTLRRQLQSQIDVQYSIATLGLSP
ncbi:hypothetical protein NQD34_018327 [Periophthalmus magnuspinnatus]|nr:hypothetical protein NQD34_018327 [Periophthalmus magnuspinnatus]